MKKLILTLILILIIILQGVTQNIPYPIIPDWESTPLGMVSTGLGLADINGDGWKDIIVANGNDMQRQHLVVYYNHGDGTFPPTPDWQSQDIDYHGHLAVGDLNADGWPDVVVSVYLGPTGFNTAGKLKIYYNQQGELESTPSFESDEFYNFSCALGDADGDGDLDVAATAGESYNEIYESGKIFFNHNGVFSATPEWNSSVLFSTLDVDFGDIDSNGKLDLVFASENGPSYIFLADSLGEIDNVPDWETAQNPVFMNSLDIAKIGQQGITGIVFSGNNQLGGEGKIKLYTFPDEIPPESTPVWSSAQSGYWSGILLHDVNLDGINDLIYGGWWLPMKIHLGNDENFNLLPSFTSQTSSVVEAIQIADLNNDGIMEQMESFPINEQANSVFYLSHTIESIQHVIISDVSLDPDYYCYVPGKNWLSINREYIIPGDMVMISYKYSRKGDIVLTNWDNSVGNYIFYNDTVITSNPEIKNRNIDFRMYPNPAHNFFTITLKKKTSKDLFISMVNINGKQVILSNSLLSKGQRSLKIDLSHISKGVYMIKLANDPYIKTKKLIIE